MDKKKFVVFGGTFDPFTVAHKEIVDKLYNMAQFLQTYLIHTTTNHHERNK